FAEQFNYVSSFRQEPQRTYYQVARSDLRVGPTGQNYIEQIAHWHEIRAPKLRQLKTLLRRLGLLHDIRPRRLGGGRFEVAVRTGAKGIPASLPDVGFGVSQLLPILVAD